MIYLNLQGKNDPDCPWFLDLDVSKEFISFFDKIDHFKLTRELGRTTKWSSKDVTMCKVVQYFLPFFSPKFIQNKRKKVFKKLSRYIQGKNEEFRLSRDYSIYLWVNSTYQIGQLEIVHNFNVETQFKPFQCQLRGSATLQSQLNLEMNFRAIVRHLKRLQMIGETSRKELPTQLKILFNQLQQLNKVLQFLDIYADHIFFFEQIQMINKKIETINMKHFYKYLLRISPYILYNIQFSEQQKNLRYCEFIALASNKTTSLIEVSPQF